jgi:site-specific DNA-methyltransferase (adenine-specific)
MALYYQEDGITIYHGDCREVLPHLETASLVVTDPPYNAKKNYGDFKDDLTPEEYADFMRAVVADCRKLSKHQFWVAPRYQMALWTGLIPDAHLIVIRRGASGPNRGGWSDQFQTALSVGKPNAVVTDLWDGIRLKGEGYFFREHTYGHPGYTPSPIFARAISLLASDSIIDPFAGTGTSLAIAKKQRLKAVGIEINEQYCEIAAKRLSQSAFNFEEVA